MDISTGNIIDVFYSLLVGTYSTIYRYGYPPNKTGEFLVLNFIPNTREKIKTGAATKITAGFGYAYITAFVPKINNGTDVFPDAARIKAIQTNINNLIDGFTTTTKVNSMVMYLDTDPTVMNDIQSHSNIIFRVLCNYS